MTIVSRTLQQMRQDLAQMMDDNYTGTADTGSTTTFLKDTMLSPHPDDHFNGYELTALFGAPESRHLQLSGDNQPQERAVHLPHPALA